MTSTTTVSFADLGVPSAMAKALESDGIAAPFPIQAQTVEHALQGRDLCGKAPTGSGKTLAFSLPVAILAETARPHRPFALILTPTRELAAQVRRTLLPLAATRGLRVAAIYGGTNIKRDVQGLRKGVDVVVATPGRLADLVQRGDINLSEVKLVVLDEADRMADMGFLPEVKRLLDRTSDDRQTLLFSATLDGDVDVLIKRYQHDPITVEIDEPVEEAGDVRHLFWHTERTERRALTAKILKDVEPAIVFTRTKRGADRLAKQLRQDGINAEAIHGDRSQRQRERALDNFSRGKATALIATDVAARGIHVDDVAVVVHYDVPATDKDYVHRSGRTGRAGAIGLVVSLVLDDTKSDVDTIQKSLDLPRGTHAIDLDHLTSDVTPDTLVSSRPSPSRPKSHAKGKGNGGGNRQGSGRQGQGGNRKRSRTNNSGSAKAGQGAGQRSGRDGERGSTSEGGEQRTRAKGGARRRRR